VPPVVVAAAPLLFRAEAPAAAAAAAAAFLSPDRGACARPAGLGASPASQPSPVGLSEMNLLLRALHFERLGRAGGSLAQPPLPP